MLKKTGTLVIKGRSELKKSKSFEDYQAPKDLVTKQSFHDTGLVKSQVMTRYDYITRKKMDLSLSEHFQGDMKFINKNIKKGEEIEYLINESTNLVVKKSLKVSRNAFKMALMHYCFYDIVKENEEMVTIVFLPISTSNNKVSCGIQKFDKVLVYSNELQKFYITRLLFNKTMTKAEYNEWLNSNQIGYKGDIQVRKIIFDEIQKDLDENHFSLLKDTDIIEPNVEFLSSELPLIKFKFTDLVL